MATNNLGAVAGAMQGMLGQMGGGKKRPPLGGASDAFRGVFDRIQNSPANALRGMLGAAKKPYKPYKKLIGKMRPFFGRGDGGYGPFGAKK